MPGEFRRNYNRAMEAAGDFFQPRRQIDGGPDASEIAARSIVHR
jgi:hypothetical protein